LDKTDVHAAVPIRLYGRGKNSIRVSVREKEMDTWMEIDRGMNKRTCMHIHTCKGTPKGKHFNNSRCKKEKCV